MKSPGFVLASVPLIFFAATQRVTAFSMLAVAQKYTFILQRNQKARLRISISAATADNDGDDDEEKGQEVVSLNEIEAMGGDPFFLDDDHSFIGTTTTTDTHFTIDPSRDDAKENETSPSSEWLQLAMAASGGGGVASLTQKLKENSLPLASSRFNVDKTDQTSSQLKDLNGGADESELDEVLAIGGDPFFLFDGINNECWKDKLADAEKDDEEHMEVLALGGDTFFLQDDDNAVSAKVENHFSVEIRSDDDDGDLSSMDRLSQKTAALSMGQNQVDVRQTHEQSDSRLLSIEMLSQVAALSANQNQGGWATGDLRLLGKTDSDHGGSSPDSATDMFEELEEMGGDPFFLDVPGNKEESVEASTLSSEISTGMRFATDGHGPTPPNVKGDEATEGDNWEWDGIVIEDAHLDVA